MPLWRKNTCFDALRRTPSEAAALLCGGDLPLAFVPPASRARGSGVVSFEGLAVGTGAGGGASLGGVSSFGIAAVMSETRVFAQYTSVTMAAAQARHSMANIKFGLGMRVFSINNPERDSGDEKHGQQDHSKGDNAVPDTKCAPDPSKQ